MKQVTLIGGLTLLYLQWSDSATPIPSGKEYVYSYTGTVKAKNSGTDLYASQWNIAAKLIMQSNGNNIVMQFKDIQTNLHNGEFDHREKAHEKAIPEEAYHLYMPFVVHYHINGSVSSISHQSNDRLWSRNMKRAIGGIVQIDTEHIEKLHEQKFYEQNIYGSCETAYTITHNGSVKIISKMIDDSLCVKDLETSWSNCLPAPGITNGFKPISTIAVRTFHFVAKDTGDLLEQIYSHSNITYQTMYNERSSLQLIQSQVFRLISESVILKPIKVMKNTESTSLEYIFDEDDSKSGRQKNQTVRAETLLENLQQYYEQFKAEFRKYPLLPADIGMNNTLAKIFTTLAEMDKNGINATAHAAVFTSDKDAKSIFTSMLPYIGTNEAADLFREAFESDQLHGLFAFKIMAAFPKYVTKYTSKLLEEMEILMRPTHLNLGDKKEIRYAGILCFATMVVEANLQAVIPVKQLEKYCTQFLKHFQDARNYEEKMINLLALINLGNLLDSDIMISIIKDKEQSHHLRSLAAYGFKPYLTTNLEQMFKRLWPEVLNQTEHYEIRVAVLDLLMSSQLTQVEFDSILEEFKQAPLDPAKKHLQNYLSTTISSLHNKTLYFDYAGPMIAESIDSVTIPNFDDAWGTGNYRLSYTDSLPNFGGYVQARLVANPITNLPNVVQLTYNQFAMSLNLGTYTAYIKLDGIADMLFIKHYLQDRPNHQIGIAELVEIIKKFNFRVVENEEIHVEVVLFCDNRIIFGVHLNKNSIDKYLENPLFLDLLEQLVHYEDIIYPKMHVGEMSSDLGTYVSTSLTETVVMSHKLTTDIEKLFADTAVKSGSWNYRSSRYELLNLESYDPLVDVKIGVYKYKSWAQRVNISVNLNVTDKYFSFDHEDDSINLVVGKTIGTTIDDEAVLKEYCSLCDTNVELPVRSPRERINRNGDFGFSFNITTVASEANNYFTDYDLIESYRSNSGAAPLAEPLLVSLYGKDYQRYLSEETGSWSLRSKVFSENVRENIFEWNFDLDDAYNKNDPINGTNLHTSVKLSWRRKSDAKILGTLTAHYTYTNGPEVQENSTKSHVVQKHKLRAEYTFEQMHYIACFDREFKYPSRRSDMWSILPVEPAKGKGNFSAGSTTKTDTCSNDFSIQFYDIFESSKHEMEKVREMDEYKQCKADSVGFKYTPPTPACDFLHETMSKYHNYTFFVDLKNAADLSEIDRKLRTSDHGFQLFELHYVHDDIVHVQLSKYFLVSHPFSPYNLDDPRLNDIAEFDTSLGVFSGMKDPTIVAYGGQDAKVGLSSICGVTPSRIYTFTDNIIEHSESKDDKEVVAYVECFDKSRGGLTIQKSTDKKIGFTMWSGDNKLVTSFVEGKLKIVLNDKELRSQYSDAEHLKVFFLEDDVVYITNQIVEVYYNTEYISIKAPSLYNKYVCGLCSRKQTNLLI